MQDVRCRSSTVTSTRDRPYIPLAHRIQESMFHMFLPIVFFLPPTIIIITDIIIITKGDVTAWQSVKMIVPVW